MTFEFMGAKLGEDFKEDVSTLLAFPKEKLDEYLREIGEGRKSTQASIVIKTGERIFGVDEDTSKKIRSVALYLIARLHPERLSTDEIIENFKKMDLLEESIKSFLSVVEGLPLSVKDEIRYGGTIREVIEELVHWRSFNITFNMKPVLDGEKLVALMPALNLTLKLGPLTGGETKTVTIEMYLDEADRLITKLNETYDAFIVTIGHLKTSLGNVIPFRPKEAE